MQAIELASNVMRDAFSDIVEDAVLTIAVCQKLDRSTDHHDTQKWHCLIYSNVHPSFFAVVRWNLFTACTALTAARKRLRGAVACATEIGASVSD